MKYIRKYLIRPMLILVGIVIVTTAIGVISPLAMIIVFIVLPIVLLIRAVFMMKRREYIGASLAIGAMLLISRMRRGETHRIRIHETQLQLGFQTKIAVISDIHVGAYKGKAYIQSIVDHLKQQTGLQAVLVVGDLTYAPASGSLEDIYKPFSQLSIPVFATLGNHDVCGKAKTQIEPELILALQKDNIQLLQNQRTTFGSGIRLLGLGDERCGNPDVTMLSGAMLQENVIVMAHNPDTVMRYGTHLAPYVMRRGRSIQNTGNITVASIDRNTLPADLTVAGHTHASQIRLFGLTSNITPTRFNRPRDGWYPDLKVFITRGLGETAVPVRLFNRVTIDVLSITK